MHTLTLGIVPTQGIQNPTSVPTNSPSIWATAEELLKLRRHAPLLTHSHKPTQSLLAISHPPSELTTSRCTTGPNQVVVPRRFSKASPFRTFYSMPQELLESLGTLSLTMTPAPTDSMVSTAIVGGVCFPFEPSSCFIGRVHHQRWPLQSGRYVTTQKFRPKIRPKPCGDAALQTHRLFRRARVDHRPLSLNPVVLVQSQA
ncbi:hypothetical protein V8D89_003491 [Ganoderma adspersum]